MLKHHFLKFSGIVVVALVATSLVFDSAWGATGKVTKVSGRKAVVEFSEPISIGDVVSTDRAGATAGGGGGGSATRQYAFAYQFAFMSVSRSGTSGSIVQTEIEWWFNFKSWEVAPIFDYSSSSVGGTSTSSMGIGVEGKYNFSANVPNASLVPAAFAKFVMYNATPSTSSYNLMGIGAGVDWFPFGEHVALTGNIEYDMLSYSQSSSNGSMIVLSSGAKVYF